MFINADTDLRGAVFDKRAVIVQLLNEGWRPSEVAVRVGTSAPYVTKIMRQEGIAPQGRRGAVPVTEARPLTRMHRRLGSAVYRWRVERGLDTTDASRLLGVPRSSLRKIETGAVELGLIDLIRIAAVLGTSVAALIADAER